MKFLRKNYSFIVAILILILIVILKYPILNLPYSWDVMNYVIPAANHIYEKGFTIFLWEYSNGHPPFYFILLGFIFKVFGNSQIVAHLVTIFFSFLAVYFTYLVCKNLFSRKVGIIASLLMLFYPTFFSYSGMSYLSIPLAALTIISIYLFIKNYKFIYVIISSFLVLTEERAIMVPLSLFFYKIIKNKKFNIKKDIILLIPFLTFGLWLLSNKLYYGYFTYPINASLLSFNIIKIMLNSFIILKSLFFDYYKWILTSLIVLSCFSFKLFKNKKKVFYSLIISIILFTFMINLSRLSIYFIKYFPNVNNYFVILKNFSILFSLLFFVLLLSFKKFIMFWNNKKLYLFYITFIFMFFSYMIFIPFPSRYGIPVYPIIFILFSVSLVKIFKKYSYIPFLIVLVLFVTQWTGHSNDVGFVLENNMEYMDMIKTHKMATNYLEYNFPNSTIIAAYPQSLELKYPYLGYVKKSFNVVSIPPYSGLTTKNSTIYFNPNKYNQIIDLNKIDIIYSSEQQFNNKYSIELNKILNKTLIKRFELNGKVAEIYKINKEFKYPNNYSLPLD